MLRVKIDNSSIQIGRHFEVSFQRTLRIPDDGRDYPLPPGLGTFPIKRVADYRDRVPASWRKRGGVFIPMYQREALWLNFDGADWRPNAVKIGVGKINAISGKAWDQELHADEQDYLVVPDQPWLDGINSGDGFINQFVAMPLGMGYTVEGQLTGKEEFGGIQIIVFNPKPGRFRKPRLSRKHNFEDTCYCALACGGAMGLGAGGRMKQDIYPDEHGIDTWNEKSFGRVYVHIVNSMMYREITGEEAPSTPVSARTYNDYGLPWFNLYNEGKGDLQPSEILKGVKSVKDMDKKKGFKPQQDDEEIDITEGQIVKLKSDPNLVQDGNW